MQDRSSKIKITCKDINIIECKKNRESLIFNMKHTIHISKFTCIITQESGLPKTISSKEDYQTVSLKSEINPVLEGGGGGGGYRDIENGVFRA